MPGLADSQTPPDLSIRKRRQSEAVRLPELKYIRSGKVREIFEVDDQRLLILATDRISAFDCILPNEIPYKGQVLTQLSRFWFNRFAGLVQNHLIAAEIADFPDDLRARLSNQSLALLNGRSMLVQRAEVIPFKCVARGYLAGSGLKEYQQTEAICGHQLPTGLVESARLPEPIFTPATKAETGHDINVSIDEMARTLGMELTQQLESFTLRLYCDAAV